MWPPGCETLSLCPYSFLHLLSPRLPVDVDKMTGAADTLVAFCPTTRWRREEKRKKAKNKAAVDDATMSRGEREKNTLKEAFKGSFARGCVTLRCSLLWSPLRSSSIQPKWAPVSWSENSGSHPDNHNCMFPGGQRRWEQEGHFFWILRPFTHLMCWNKLFLTGDWVFSHRI